MRRSRVTSVVVVSGSNKKEEYRIIAWSGGLRMGSDRLHHRSSTTFGPSFIPLFHGTPVLNPRPNKAAVSGCWLEKGTSITHQAEQIPPQIAPIPRTGLEVQRESVYHPFAATCRSWTFLQNWLSGMVETWPRSCDMDASEPVEQTCVEGKTARQAAPLIPSTELMCNH